MVQPRRVFLLLLTSVAGVVAGIPLGSAALDAIDPHRSLVDAGANRLYVASHCGFTERALEAISSPPPRSLAIIVVDPAPSSFRSEHCIATLNLLAKARWEWWMMLPDRVLCAQLSHHARLSLLEEYDNSIPAWFTGVDYIGAGVSPEIMLRVKQSGMLDDTKKQ